MFAAATRRTLFRNIPTTHTYRYGSTLAFIEYNAKQNVLTPASRSCLQAAKKLNQPITALLLGSNSDKVAIKDTPNIVSKVLYNTDLKFDHQSPEYISPLICDILNKQNFTHFVIAANSVGKNILPRVAALLDLQPISDIVDIESDKQFVRPIYAGNILATVQSEQPKKLISIRTSAFPIDEEETQAKVDNAVSIPTQEYQFEIPSDIKSTQYVGSSTVQNEDGRPDLNSAKVIVSGGRGLKTKENFEKLIVPLADAFKKVPKYNGVAAAIGATRAVVDAGFVDNSLQIGQTGKVVAPDLYIACGISGAIQHLAGMKNSKVIVAINKEEDQPIEEIADFTLIGDVNDVLPELTEKLG
ncbi:related to Probable electron transfer flavoprotein subunit alpha, mitochondrial [Saccharomycodes ludwigii]|uniref:Probable electron transfer flavoprotein subunit alpha n=1 Tax=Saccharomycodes ludwigii TaxID=36035 RepID=A0A376B508_9ASCO|nr:hypothetical protein SCDLUD_000601 [Saccharomycodes ludwigii]KAH3902998.1 hypothetical protein SCDLUD_000601 [Saccharomycodes ludwigii]SSD59775.1 related to Probable electron transfer flavoprotein subunit alpha, mitochondrial [Saccharomycodes ludwigii]